MAPDGGIAESESFSEPLRPWLPVDLLDNAARTISDNKTIMLGLPVIAGIGLTALQLGLTQVAVPGGLSGLFEADNPFGVGGLPVLLMYAVQAILFTMVASMLSGIVALAAVRSQLGRRVGARELLRLVRPALPALAVVGLAQSAGFALLAAGWLLALFGMAAGAESATNSAIAGLVALVLMGTGGLVALIFGIRISLAGTVVLLEGRHAPDVGLYIPAPVGVIGALKRSWALVRGRFWRVFGILMFAGLVIYLVSNAMQLGITLLISATAGWAGASDNGPGAIAVTVALAVAAGAAAVLTTIASLAFLSAVQALVYLDLRVRREGLDLWLRPALKPPLRPTPPPTLDPMLNPALRPVPRPGA
ncbi:hypothetical protein [Kribbella deserti]|uniref:Glycerophosphoryl diester phosphodiesterase membrane domain-containing protein n=1 Tax=Kribbella deserti TaxID=1926257 RepID=A0ABV6QRL6_9ACTN